MLSRLNPEITDIDRENIHHWGATQKFMQIIRKRDKSPDTRMLVEQRNTLSRPGAFRRRYDPDSQRTIFAHSCPNKHSRDKIAGLDAELLQRGQLLGAATSQLQMK